MKIFVKEKAELPETEVHILCRKRNEQIESIVTMLKQHTVSIHGRSLQNGDMTIAKLIDILYFESVDKKIYFYTKQGIFESDYKLYQLEEICDINYFLRISKTTIVNLKMVATILPEDGRRLKIKLINDEWLMVSRMYTKDFKALLHI